MRIFHRQFNRAQLKEEKGEILLPTLLFVLLGFIMIIPLVSFMGTGLKTGMIFKQKAETLYSADAGVEDAIWKIKYNHLKTTLEGYDPVDFNTEFTYDLPQVSGKPQVNDTAVDVIIQNLWIPKQIDAPDTATANGIIADNSVTIAGGGIKSNSSYHIAIAYNPESGDDFKLNAIGVWLPPGFTYTTGSSNLDNSSSSGKPYHSVPAVSDHMGGKAIIWSFSALDYTSFPDVSTLDEPMTTEISFNYSTTLNATPDAVSWVSYQGLSSGPTYSWDTDVRVFNVTSTADSTTVKTYLAKTEIRKVGGSLNGDYYATGNTLMRNAVYDSGHIRDTWLNTDSANTNSSSQTVTTVPSDSNIQKAYLYWTGWIRDNFLDLCSNMNNWTTGASNCWSLYNSSTFRGQWASGKTRYIYLSSDKDIRNSSKAYVSWDQYVSTPSSGNISPINPDYCSNFNNWNHGNVWTVNNNFKGLYVSSPTRDLSSMTYLNLSSYAGASGTITVSWTQGHSGTFSSSEGFDCYYATTSSAPTDPDWTLIHQFRSTEINNSSNSCVTPVITLPSRLWIKFSLVGTTPAIYFTLDNIYVRATAAYASTDGITLSVSSDSGITYTDIQTYHANITSEVDTTSQTVSVSLPSDYLNRDDLNLFRIKFTLNGFNGAGEYYYLDNIKITAVQPGIFDSIYFKINDTQVYLDAENGNYPTEGSVNTVADTSSDIINATSGTKGYSFACFKDVTDLIKAFSEGGDWSDPEPENRADGNGNAKYTIGNVMASLGVDGHDSYGDQLAHAGWSLIIVYQSPETLGHTIILRDLFSFADDDTTANPMRGDLDFDKNGLPGGDIAGFTVPAQTKDADGNWEQDAAKITCFVGEGDAHLDGDFIALNAPAQYWDTNFSTDPPSSIPLYYKLWDGESSATNNSSTQRNNVWNSLSTTCTADGIDVDTFTIKWTDGLISPGQTSAHFDMYTDDDNWNLVYVIFSFRSEVVTSGSLSYLIRG
jgi:hypothetical protein